jgi:isoaspartyl peptidase/L-asparaginase-like protein (Ntn-hydrolase superfamily)
VDRIIEQEDGKTKLQVGYIALGKDGKIGYASIQKGFQYALHKNGTNKLYDVKSVL